MKIVVDSHLLVRAFLQPNGFANQLLLAIVDSDHSLLLSNEILLEVSRVLRYPRLIELHRKSEEAVYEFVGWLRIVAETAVLDPFIRAPIRDENDVFVLHTALSGGAGVLCTCDRDFFEPPASIFLKNREIEVLTDVELMRRLRT